MILEKLKEKIIEKSKENAEYREILLKDPKAIFEKEAGKKLKDDITIQVEEETPNKVVVVLPSNTEELSDSDLDSVSGGGILDILFG